MVKKYTRYIVLALLLLTGRALIAQNEMPNLGGLTETLIGSRNSASSAHYYPVRESLMVRSFKGLLSDMREELNFYHRPVSGDVEMVAKIERLASLNGNTVAGLMLRSSLSPDSAFAAIQVNFESGVVAYSRKENGVSKVDQSSLVPIRGSVHLGLVREGDSISVYYGSGDADDKWEPLGRPFTVAMADKVEAGLYAASLDSVPARIRFSEISIEDSGSGSFEERAGNVLFEAEDFTAQSDGQNGEYWEKHSLSGNSGYSLHAVPNRDVNTGLDTTGAKLEYKFNISTPSEYYIYVRGADQEGNGKNDSLHVAIDGQVLTNHSGIGLSHFTKPLTWQQMAGNVPAKLKTPHLKTGQHSLTLWSREDGVIVDRIALSTDANLSPAYLNGSANSLRKNDSPTMPDPLQVLQGLREKSIPVQWVNASQFLSLNIPALLLGKAESSSIAFSAINLPFWLSFDGSTLSGVVPAHVLNQTVTIRAKSGREYVDMSFQLQVGSRKQTAWRSAGIEIADTTWSMLHLRWDNPWGDRKPVLLQRSEDTQFTKPDLKAAQSYDNFIWIGQGKSVKRYKDLFNWKQAGKRFFYRLTAVLNYSDVVHFGAEPVFGEWKTGDGKLDKLPDTWKTYEVTSVGFGADPTGNSNSWRAIVAAVNAAKSAGGGRVLLPAGTYTAWPTDSSVRWDGRFLSANPGAEFISSMINGQTSNLVIEGEVDNNGKPLTRLNLRLWHNRSGKDFLVVLNREAGNPDQDVADIRRYGFWKVGDRNHAVENVQLRNIHIDMTAQPVQSGKGWESHESLRHEWDPSQKLVYGFDNARNILLENVVAENIRGEICYWGGFGCEKYKLSNVTLRRSNSSIISMSADAEFENVYLADAANALVESAPHSLNDDQASGKALVSPFGKNLTFFQDTIIRNLRGRVLDQSREGVMRHLPGLKNFAGMHIMNQKGTFFSVTDTVLEEFNSNGFAPWHENYDGFVSGLTLKNPTKENVGFIDFRPSPKADYKLDGGMKNIWIIDTSIELNRDVGNGGALLYTVSNMPSMDDVLIEGLHVRGNGHVLNRVWQDKYTSHEGRNNFVLDHWSFDDLSTDQARIVIDIGGNGQRKHPLFGPNFNFFSKTVYVTDNNPGFVLDWPHVEVASHGNNKNYAIRPTNLSQLVVGQEYSIQVKNRKDVVYIPRDSGWNTFTKDYSLTGNQRFRCRVVNSNGTKKLAFESIDDHKLPLTL